MCGRESLLGIVGKRMAGALSYCVRVPDTLTQRKRSGSLTHGGGMNGRDASTSSDAVPGKRVGLSHRI